MFRLLTKVGGVVGGAQLENIFQFIECRMELKNKIRGRNWTLLQIAFHLMTWCNFTRKNNGSWVNGEAREIQLKLVRMTLRCYSCFVLRGFSLVPSINPHFHDSLRLRPVSSIGYHWCSHSTRFYSERFDTMNRECTQKIHTKTFILNFIYCSLGRQFKVGYTNKIYCFL